MLKAASQPSHTQQCGRQAVALLILNPANTDAWLGHRHLLAKCRLPGHPGWAVLAVDQGNPSAEHAQRCRPTCPSRTSLAWAPSTTTRAVACLPIPVELRDALSLRTRIGVPSSRASSTARPADMQRAGLPTAARWRSPGKGAVRAHTSVCVQFLATPESLAHQLVAYIHTATRGNVKLRPA